MQERPRYRQPLAHAAREFPHQAVAHALETGSLQPLASGALCVGQLVEPGEEPQIFESGELVIHRNPVPDKADATPRVRLTGILPKDVYLALARFRKASQDA